MAGTWCHGNTQIATLTPAVYRRMGGLRDIIYSVWQPIGTRQGRHDTPDYFSVSPRRSPCSWCSAVKIGILAYGCRKHMPMGIRHVIQTLSPILPLPTRVSEMGTWTSLPTGALAATFTGRRVNKTYCHGTPMEPRCADATYARPRHRQRQRQRCAMKAQRLGHVFSLGRPLTHRKRKQTSPPARTMQPASTNIP
ncbi:hypothetical protein K505DRAFT_10927 [Melanomma pulvis-pyrius CBS 109.77]|uniref:Uncharacterized protein n=1 Tax=Melanomma pulvis-pyrius CBS 109.77 TaxID=1314802 RepID=A0A6A6XG97_9PLEO|nr:hypothetical protein K505DRAFT_10927 [Melanomma pulvis-pyrius CBS 109.77]